MGGKNSRLYGSKHAEHVVDQDVKVQVQDELFPAPGNSVQLLASKRHSQAILNKSTLLSKNQLLSICQNPQCRTREIYTTVEKGFQRPSRNESSSEDLHLPLRALKCGELPIYGGILNMTYIGFCEVPDSRGDMHIVFVVVCRWEKEGLSTQQWVCNYWYSSYRTLRQKVNQILADDLVTLGEKRLSNTVYHDHNKIPLLPKLPTITMNKDERSILELAPSTRTKYLSRFLVSFLSLDYAKQLDENGNSKLLLLPEVDTLFEISNSILTTNE